VVVAVCPFFASYFLSDSRGSVDTEFASLFNPSRRTKSGDSEVISDSLRADETNKTKESPSGSLCERSSEFPGEQKRVGENKQVVPTREMLMRCVEQ
jgi:hypothetical protein